MYILPFLSCLQFTECIKKPYRLKNETVQSLWSEFHKHIPSSLKITWYFLTLTITTLWAYSADDKLIIFFLFFPENMLWHFIQIVFCSKLSSVETICTKCQILFSRKTKNKNFKLSSAEIFTQRSKHLQTKCSYYHHQLLSSIFSISKAPLLWILRDCITPYWGMSTNISNRLE